VLTQIGVLTMVQKRTANIHVKTTEATKIKFTKLADSKEKTISELIRDLLNEDCLKHNIN